MTIVILLSLITLSCCSNTTTIEPIIHEFHNDQKLTTFYGTYFSSEGEVVFTTRNFLTFLVYDNSILSDKLEMISNIISKFELKMENNHMISIYNTKINNLINVTNNLQNVNNKFLERLGYYNVAKDHNLGFSENNYKHLITDSHMETVKAIINSSDGELSDFLNDKASIVRLKPETFHRELFRIYIDLNKTFEIFNEYFTKKKESHFRNTSLELILSQAINAIQLNIQSLYDYVTNINNEINKSIYGTVSHILLPANSFENILKTYQDTNKDDLIYTVSQMYLPSYYAISETIAVRKYGKSFIFIIRTPLNSVKGGKYFLYKATSFWYLNNNNIGEKIQTENRYLAVSLDNTYYSELLDLSTCTFHNHIQLCIPMSAFFSIRGQPSCLSALFMKNNNDVLLSCEKLLAKSFSVTIIKADKEGWIISSQNELEITQTCPGDDHTDQNQFKISKGVSYIYPKTDCTLSKNSVFFMPVFDEHKKTTYLSQERAAYKELSPNTEPPNIYSLINQFTGTFSYSTLQCLSATYKRNLYDLISIVLIILLLIISLIEISLNIKKNKKLPPPPPKDTLKKDYILPSIVNKPTPPELPPPIPIPLPRTSRLTKLPPSPIDDDGYMICSSPTSLSKNLNF